MAAAVGAEVFGVAQQVVALAFDEGAAFAIRLGLGAAAHFVDDFAEVGDEMEFVEDDVGLRQMGLEGGAVGPAAINADGGDAGFLLRTQLGEEAFEGILSAPLGQPEQFTVTGVEHEANKACFAQVLFVDEQRFEPVKVRRRQFALEDVTVVAIGTGRRHGHYFAHPLHRQPPAQQADMAHQTQRGHVLFDNAERA